MSSTAPEPPDPAPALQRLQRLLGGPSLAALRQRLRRAYEQATAGSEPALLRLSGLAAHETEALQALTGRPPRQTASLQIDLAELSMRLQAAGLAGNLRQALELLDGPIAARADERAAALAAWSALAAAAPHPALASLLAEPRGLGLLKRLAAADARPARALCERAARVLAELPARGRPRAQLAAQCLGDAHALDDGQPTATLVLAALRRAAPEDPEDGTRAQWAAQGVTVNELARPALMLNLPLADQEADGEPRYWSLRQLLRSPPACRVAGRAVYVCENPNLLAMAADTLGPRCAPLLCTDGMPAAAQRALLAQLAAAGARLHYHGDYDWPGIAIGNRVLQDYGARAWRYSAADYLSATRLAQASAQAPLRGNPVAALWDSLLAGAMQQMQLAIAEEALLDSLLPDLAVGA
jgi:uncharacterized protein (TIGR02679 family)